MPRETLNLQRVSALIAAYDAGLVDLDETDLAKIETVLKHALKEISP